MSTEEPTSAPLAEASPAPAPAAEVPETASKPSASPSTTKKVARPGKPRTSVSGGSKKAAPSENKSFSFGEIVLARLKGYPPWPARICNPDDVPASVQKSRSGKGPSIYCVQFFPVGDYAWLQGRDISPLKPHEIQGYINEPHRKAAGGLMEAYQTAADPTEWEKEQNEIRIKRENAEVAANEDVDELEDEEEAETGGKRKRTAAEKKDKKKRAKVEKKAKNGDAEPKAKATPKSKSEKSTKAPASKPVDNHEPVDDDPLASNPECVKVKDWRHKLQRAFLGKGLPTTDEMSTYDDLFKTIEKYDTMTIEALQYSKIGKVMKKIATLDGIPRNDELKITERASKLMKEWSDFISNNESKPNGANGEPKPAAETETKETKETKEDVAKPAPAPAESEPASAPAEANGEGAKIEVDAAAS